MFYRLLVVCAFCIFMGVSSGAADKKRPADKKKENEQAPLTEEKEKKPITREIIAANINSIKKIILKGQNKGKIPLRSMQLKYFANSFDHYVKLDDIEKITRISRKWFAKCRDILNLMFIPRAKMDTALLNGKKKVYDEAEIEYNKKFKIFEKLIKHPEKPKKKKKRKVNN
jgi:hypothetical protein